MAPALLAVAYKFNSNLENALGHQVSGLVQDHDLDRRLDPLVLLAIRRLHAESQPARLAGGGGGGGVGSVAVALNATTPTPDTTAFSVLLPAAGPRVHRMDARPSESVVVLSELRSRRQ